MSPHRAVLAGVCALGLLAGCTATASGVGAPAEPPVAAIPTLLSSVDLRLPAEDYLATADQNYRLGRARLTLIAGCLARFGVHYAAEQPSLTGYGPRSTTDRRYGVTDEALARTAGYGLGARDPAKMTRPVPPKLGVDGQTLLSGQGRSVVRGSPVPAGGCLGEADHALQAGAPPGADLHAADLLMQRSFEQSRADSRVVAALGAWSRCMRDAGYRYADPIAAASDPAFAGPATPEQITVAVDDIACKARTNLVGVWFTVESAYQRREIANRQAALDATRAAIVARDRVASAAIR